jgi:hypothetical protein
MCLRLIDAKKAQHPVSRLCEVLGVSRAGYYAWKQRPASARRRRDIELMDVIRAVHGESKATYGWPRVHAELRHRGVRASRTRVARLMREAGLSGMVRRRRGRTTVSVPGIATAPDLVRRGFAPSAPNRLWVADLTEIATWKASSISPWSSTASRGAALAGRWPTTCAPSSSSRPWKWRSGNGVLASAWCITAIAAGRADSRGRRNTSM